MLMEKESERERLSALCPIDTCRAKSASDRYYFYSVRDVYFPRIFFHFQEVYILSQLRLHFNNGSW
jgi:hypothetical protein